ncbi:TPA: hypothetical protein HA316_03375 [Candidatus Micrarchaeota archaeon]|nr:hypothetical protein [Candidatus Micrarchaeota archaeon]
MLNAHLFQVVALVLAYPHEFLTVQQQQQQEIAPIFQFSVRQPASSLYLLQFVVFQALSVELLLHQQL